jgi:predicted RNA-binding protein with PUA-like domain
MQYWLMKTEPGDWSWQDQLNKGEVGEEWDGVRNYQARNNMRRMKIGDRAFFYHSVKEKSIVGIVEVISESHQDSTTTDTRWECVDVKAIKPFPKPVSLEDIKNTVELQDMILLKNSRLSVQPITEYQWNLICKMGNVT